MERSVILNAFNELNIILINDCIQLIPDSVDLATLKNALTALIATTPELNIITFKECTVKHYRSVIEERDVQFFVEHKYDDNVKEIGISKLVLENIDCLRVPVGKMKKSNQNKIFDYLNKMIKLSDMYN